MIIADKLKSALQKNALAATKQHSDYIQQINDIEEELHWVKHSPLPVEDAILNVESFVKPDAVIDGLNHFFYSHELAGLKPFELVITRDNEMEVKKTDTSNLMCSLFGATIKKSLVDQITAAAKNIKSGPPLAERKQLTVDLLSKKHLLEIEEEDLICNAEELGLSGLYRRENCDPEIVLMMEVD